ncbi:MAG: hypothetical protein HC884_07315 [Chloroflexaceae bacterium]|nr:hypothetical protein [Chloroflexaceae bacterium]
MPVTNNHPDYPDDRDAPGHPGSPDHPVLQQEPPRHLPPGVVLGLYVDYLNHHPRLFYLDIPLIGGILATTLLVLLRAGGFWKLSFAIVVLRLGMLLWKVNRRTHQQMMLLKHGNVVEAYILRTRPCLDSQGNDQGACLDCLVPAGPRRISVGSVWVADGARAEQMRKQGRTRAICLARAPGIWHLLDATATSAWLRPRSASQSKAQPEPDHP